ncbi:hypothetical protein GCM10017322_15810 [Paracoccus aerius]|nr:hypothetical protein GCM10017322_15810 [Paracoccus aerius]
MVKRAVDAMRMNVRARGNGTALAKAVPIGAKIGHDAGRLVGIEVGKLQYLTHAIRPGRMRRVVVLPFRHCLTLVTGAPRNTDTLYTPTA